MAKFARINLGIRYQGIGEGKVLDNSYIVSGLAAENNQKYYLSGGQSAVVNNIAISGQTTGLFITNVSAASTYASGLFVMLSGQKPESAIQIKAGQTNMLTPTCGLMNIHLYCSAMGTETGGTFLEFSAFE